MVIDKLSLKNFRNYDSLSIDLKDGLTVFCGKNGAGKTNIVEAIYICTTGKSYRTNNERDLIKHNQDEFNIELSTRSEGFNKKINYEWNEITGRKVLINGTKIKKIGELMGVVKAIIFAPEDLLIVKGAPALRRKFIDICLSQISSTYFYHLQQYQKVLKQRNALLKMIRNNEQSICTLSVWNDSLVDIGSKIILARIKYINESNHFYRLRHKELTGDNAEFRIEYNSNIFIHPEKEIENIRVEFENCIQKNENTDIVRQSTSVGPHRDDYNFFLGKDDLKLYGSQGQQRTAVLALKFGEIDMFKKCTDEYPVLLLDDVLSELDSERQKYLFSSIKDTQTIITSATMDVLNGLDNNFSIYHIKDGNVLET